MLEDLVHVIDVPLCIIHWKIHAKDAAREVLYQSSHSPYFPFISHQSAMIAYDLDHPFLTAPRG